MPTYEYVCRDCGEHLEVVQSFRDDPLTVCPACDGRLRKVFAAAGIVFKGSGWHVKDYAPSRSKSSRERESSSEPATTTDGAADSTKKKPAEAAAPKEGAEKKSA
ncbi:MAG: FmdB family zinc ribbon protein [Nitriliruptorales bacterium]